MRVRISPRPAGVPADLGAPVLPGSKSHGQRALLLATFTRGHWTLRNVPASDDLVVLRDALVRCGAAIQCVGETWIVDGIDLAPGQTLRIDARENGTAARLLLMVLPLLGCALELDGQAGLRRRPMLAAVQALRAFGVPCSSDVLPVRADGRGMAVGPGAVLTVDAATTTQAASGAMLAAGLRGGATVHVAGALADGYVALTAQLLRQFGANVAVSATGGEQTFAIGQLRGSGGDVTLPADPSARAFPVVLAAMHGLHLPPALQVLTGDAHPDWHLDADVARLHESTGDVLLAHLAQRPDCVPALAVLAALRRGTTVMPGLHALRSKESDRLAAMANGLSAAGAEASVTDDTLTVRGPLRSMQERVVLPTTADHRIVMALALLGTILPRSIELDRAEAVAKSWPSFFAWLTRCAQVEFVDAP